MSMVMTSGGIEPVLEHDLVAPVQTDEHAELRGTVDQRRHRELCQRRVALERVLADLLGLLDRLAHRVPAAHRGEWIRRRATARVGRGRRHIPSGSRRQPAAVNAGPTAHRGERIRRGTAARIGRRRGDIPG